MSPPLGLTISEGQSWRRILAFLVCLTLAMKVGRWRPFADEASGQQRVTFRFGGPSECSAGLSVRDYVFNGSTCCSICGLRVGQEAPTCEEWELVLATIIVASTRVINTSEAPAALYTELL